jgi:hypothetical protein
VGRALCGGPSLLAGSPQVLVGSVRRRVEGQLHATVVPEPRDAMDSRASPWVMVARGPQAIDRGRYAEE